MSPTQRALRDLREEGYLAAVVEYWNPHAGRRVDLFGIVDIIAVKPDHVLFVQATSGTNHSKRVQKLQTHESTPRLTGSLVCRLEVWSYSKRKVKRGGKAYRYHLRREAL